MPIHQFTVGEMTCTVLSELESQIPYDENVTNFFITATFEEIRAAADEIGEGEFMTNAINILLIQSDGTNLLVDTGIGNPERSGLMGALAEAGIGADQIDIVFITHLHGDHYGGLIVNDEVMFPNARYVVNRAEWEYWLSDETLAGSGPRVDGVKTGVLPLAAKFSFVEPDGEIIPGVEVVRAYGHSPGHVGLYITSGDDSLLFMSDSVNRVIQLSRPTWHFAYDQDKEQAVQSRIAMLSRAADTGTLTMFYHLPFPGLGNVTRVGDAFRWQPIDS
ncbi:MAG: MBL fold metallo-hydrolase [Anaerolineae bacterium]|nr:MBL fold metallo-hydrolase [Anaerolineae bacterium]